MRTFLTFVGLLIPMLLSAQGPIQRNTMTTNQFMNNPQSGWIAIWNSVAGKWSNGVNTASATNEAQPPSTVLSNLTATGVAPGATNASAYIASLSGLGSNTHIKALVGTSRALLVNTNVLVVTNGNVGVGTDAPDTKLRVVGEFLVTGGDITAHTGANFRDDAFAGDKVLITGVGPNAAIEEGSVTVNQLLSFNNKIANLNGLGTNTSITNMTVRGRLMVTNPAPTGPSMMVEGNTHFTDNLTNDAIASLNAVIGAGIFQWNGALSAFSQDLTVSGPLTAADNLLATYLTPDRRAILGNDSSLTNAYKHYFYDTNSAPTLSNKVANVSAGDTVELGEGVFNIGPQTIRVPVGARLIGQGIDKTIISGTVGADTNAIVLLSSTNIIEDLTVEAGNRTAYLQYPMGLSSGLGHRAATNITLRRVKLDGESDGLFIVHSNYCSGWIEDCNFISKFDSCNLLGNLSTGTPWPGQDWTIINTRLIADVAGATEPASLANNGATPLKVAHGRVTLLQCNVVATNGDTTACATSFGDTNLFIIVGGRWESAGTNISRVLTESTGNSTFDVTGTSINHSNVSSLVNLVLWRQYEASHLSAGGIKFTGGQTANSVLGLNSTTNVVPLALSGLTFHASGNVLSNSAAAGAGTPGGFSGSVQFNEGGAFAGTNRFLYDRTNEVLSLVGSSAGTVRLYDSDSSHSVNLIGNATLASNLNLTFPAAMSNGVLTVVSVNDSNFNVVVVPSISQTNWILLKPTAAKMASTNSAYPDNVLQTGFLAYPHTNAVGAVVALSATFDQLVLPENYTTNTLRLDLYSLITATNGPNASNVIWQATILRHNTAGQTSTNDAQVGPFDAGSSTLTTTWTASPTGTNKVQLSSVLITNCTVAGGESFSMKLERLNANAADLIGSGVAGVTAARLKFATQ